MRDTQNQKVGIMGGTFDPIHYGHLFIAECSKHQFCLDNVIFIPSGNPVHKKRDDILECTHRLQMTRLAVESNPYFQVSAVEVERPGPTYAIDTLQELLKINEKTDFFFITGTDAFSEILTWKDISHLFELCSFITVTRPGCPRKEVDQVLTKLSGEQRAKIHFFENTGISISSTDIRQRVLMGKPIKYLVPEPVEQYIIAHDLYKK